VIYNNQYKSYNKNLIALVSVSWEILNKEKEKYILLQLNKNYSLIKLHHSDNKWVAYLNNIIRFNKHKEKLMNLLMNIKEIKISI